MGFFPIQSDPPPSDSACHPVRPLRSTFITRFAATMGLSDAPARPDSRYGFRESVDAATARRGLPSCVTQLSARAVRFDPGRPNGSCLLLLPLVLGFAISERLAACVFRVTRLFPVHAFALRLGRSLPWASGSTLPPARPRSLHVIQAITWLIPFTQQVECALLGAPENTEYTGH